MLAHMQKFLILVFGIAFLFSPILIAQPDDPILVKPEAVGMSTETLSQLNQIIEKHVDDGAIQGAVVAVSRHEQTVYFEARGFSNVDTQEVLKSDALFHLASSTKPISGVAAMIAMERGYFKPSDLVEKYIPGFKNIPVAVLDEPQTRDISPAYVWASPVDNDSGFFTRMLDRIWFRFTDGFILHVPEHRLVPADRPITIHDLLTHTAGLAAMGLGTAVADWNKAMLGPNDEVLLHEKTLASFIDEVASGPLDFQPGTRWMYSGTIGLDVVGRIIEITSGQPYNEFVIENIFDPLDMRDTYWNIPSDEYPRLLDIPNDKGGWNKTDTSYFSASIGLASTAKDLLHFEQMLANRGTFRGRKILDESSFEMMSANHVGDLWSKESKGKSAGLGFGYTVSVVLDPEVAHVPMSRGALYWAGATGTLTWAEPTTGIAVAIMVQQPNWELNREISLAINASIIDRE